VHSLLLLLLSLLQLLLMLLLLQHSFNGVFQDNLESRHQIATILDFIGAMMMEVVVTYSVKAVKGEIIIFHKSAHPRFFHPCLNQ